MTNTYSLRVPAIARRVLASQAREGQQKDELCGPFWAAVTVTALTGQQVTQDDAAVAAGTLLTAGGGSPEDLPPGAAGRTDYIRAINSTPDTRLAGTSPRGIVRAIGELSSGAVTAVPISGPWSETAIDALTDLVLGGEDTIAILNVATRYLWDTHTGFPDVLDYLAGADVTCAAANWQVGHYIAVVGSLTGSQRRLLLCADTYPGLGVRGVHAQPPGRVASALRRDDAQASGGVIVAVRAHRAPEIREWAGGLALDAGYWDNGVPDAEPARSILPGDLAP